MNLLNEEQDKEIEERLAEREDLADEELKELEVKQMKYNMQAKLFLPEGRWRDGLENIVDFKVLKMAKIIQSCFYLMKFTREQICEEKTNKMFWKKAKLLVLDDLCKRIYDYKILGPKDD